MNIFPYRKFSIETTKSKEEVLQIIELNTKPKHFYNIYALKSDKFFRGKITEDGFNISQVIDSVSYAPPVLPYDILAIKGRIADEGSKTIITISMRPIMPFVIFRIIYLVLTVIAIIRFLYAPYFILIALSFFGITYRLLYKAFKNEADKSQEKLNQMLS